MFENTPVYILQVFMSFFSNFCWSDDSVYMPNEGELAEYVQNDVGKVWSNFSPLLPPPQKKSQKT